MPEFLTPRRESRAKKVNEDLPQAILPIREFVEMLHR
jgi:hypothetical protein